MRLQNLLVILLMFVSVRSLSQGMAVASDTARADISAMLEVRSTSQGLLLPRITDAQRNAIASPKAGLLIYNTTTANLNIYKGSNWYEVAATSCVPQPTASNAGSNQTVTGTVTLAANTPVTGTGAWTITSGTGGSVTSSSSPTSTFTGVPSTTYTLTWTITTSCAASSSTVTITIATPTCSDGIKNGAETDIDCGGTSCGPCGTGLHCLLARDCASSDCSGGVCLAATCSDGIKNGAETDIDCGGGTCSTCSTGRGCVSNSDCSSNACDGISFDCVTTQCADHRKDGSETDVDCGGGTCATCSTGLRCVTDADCSSNACDGISFTCVTSQCADHRKDGIETDIDCGGGTCSSCSIGLHCSVNSDCASNACDALSHTCIASQCADHRKDGAETDIDCGGGTCSTCAVGLGCLSSTDCNPGHTCNVSHICQ